MEPLQSLADENKTDLKHVVNYLLKSTNSKKDKKQGDIVGDYMINESKPVFLYEFFVFELYVPTEILKSIKQPVLAFRFLDFPTLTVEGKVEENKELISFNQGKNCFFEMELHQLKEYLNNEPLYIMFLDMNYGDMKIIGTSRVNVSIFSFNQFLQYTGLNPPQPRRNILKLFDNVSSKVAEFDISLIIRREYFKYDTQENVNVNESLTNKKKEILINDPYSNRTQHSQSLEELLKNNQLYIIPKENVGKPLLTREEIMRELNSVKKETGTNTREEYIANEKVTKQKEENFLNPNSQNYISNLKSLLEGKGKNPPPLYFHHHRDRRSENVIVKVINESEKSPNHVDCSTQAGGFQTKTSVNKVSKPNELEKIKENVKMRETQQTKPVSNTKNVEYVKRIPSKPPQIIPPVNKQIKQQNGEIYEKKMKEVSRYSSSRRKNNSSIDSKYSKDYSKQFIEEEVENLENNEYYNLFSKIKQHSQHSDNRTKEKNSYNNTLQTNSVDDNYKSTVKSESKKNSHSNSVSKKGDVGNKEDDYNSKFYEKDKFYEISNTNQFELNGGMRGSQNELFRSYNSLSMSNSVPIEIKGAERLNLINNKRILKNVKFEEKENSKQAEKPVENNELKRESVREDTEGIEEDIYQSSQLNNTRKSSSAKRKITEDEIVEDYDDFDYDHVEENDSKYNNKVSNTNKDESLIEDFIS